MSPEGIPTWFIDFFFLLVGMVSVVLAFLRPFWRYFHAVFALLIVTPASSPQLLYLSVVVDVDERKTPAGTPTITGPRCRSGGKNSEISVLLYVVLPLLLTSLTSLLLSRSPCGPKNPA